VEAEEELLEELATEYFTLIQEVKMTLHGHVDSVTEALPPQRSSYGAQRDLDIATAKAGIVRNRLAAMTALFEVRYSGVIVEYPIPQYRTVERQVQRSGLWSVSQV